jgi:hypothetical protein
MAETVPPSPQIARKISIADIEVRERDGFSYQPLVETSVGLGYNLNLVNVHGRHYRTRITGVTRTYFVESGEGTFTLNGEVHQVKEHDSYVISSGDDYEYQGQMVLVEFNVPGATRENETNLDNV